MANPIIIPSTERTRDLYEGKHPKWVESAKSQPFRVEFGDHDLQYDNGYYRSPGMSFVPSMQMAKDIIFERISETIRNKWGSIVVCLFDNQTNVLLATYNSKNYEHRYRRRR